MLRGLAQYRVLQCLASGSQGKVYLAMDTRLSRRVCIKLYSLHGTLGDRRRAVAEAWHLTRVQSPLTVSVYDVIVHHKSLALVTAYVPGCTLDDLLKIDESLPVANAVSIASDIATALASLRQARLVHGDLSARNVLISPSGRATLADFGIAHWSGETPVGLSKDSMSPEQSRGEATDLRSDFFSLGLLLHRMVYGSHPFYRTGGVDTLLLANGLLATEAIKGLSESASQPIRSLLVSLLAASPAERPPGTYELREQLRVARSMLPAPDSVRPRVLAALEQKPRIDESLRLPVKLVNLPFRHHLRAWLLRYWQSGSLGARVLLLITSLLPLGILTLMLLRPGVCLEVEAPLINASATVREILPDRSHLHRLLTAALKSAADSAAVLGWGEASDSYFSLSSTGIRDQCTAQRTLSLLIECEEEDCLFQTRARTPDGVQLSELTVKLGDGFRTLENALQQLVEQQTAFLLDD